MSSVEYEVGDGDGGHDVVGHVTIGPSFVHENMRVM
jgi:hypothetical protein